MLKIPAPRLLPATIVILAALLSLKCGAILQAVVNHGSIPDSVMVAAANAASTDQVKEPARPATGSTAAAPHEKAGAAPSPAASPPTAPIAVPPAPTGPPPVSDSEKALLQDLRQRRQELDTRADAIATRESVMVATEQKLMARLGELQVLQKKLEGLDAAQKQKEDAGWQGLVKLYARSVSQVERDLLQALRMAR